VFNDLQQNLDSFICYLSNLLSPKALKEYDIFIIIDHVAESDSGSGYDIANTLHRIDPNIVKFQLEEAGFTLIEEALYLRNTKGDLDKSVFATDTRGRTDRFIYKFAKQQIKYY
jgi:predicted methyltransferase